MKMYFIALVADEAINRTVLQWKLWMKENFGCVVALRSPAHITLIPPFWMNPDLENELAGTLRGFVSGREGFLVQLNNFSHFDNKVIFVNVTQNTQLVSFQKELSDLFAASARFPIEKDDRVFHPHITIATRDLYKKAFRESWENFSNKQYKAEWKVKGVSILRHNDHSWEVTSTEPID